MRVAADLKRVLSRVDGRGYKAYRDIEGAYDYGEFILFVDHIQGDPFASPSKVRVQVPQKMAKFPRDVYRTKSRQVALRDFLTRRFVEAARRDQGMVRIVELGSETEVLGEVDHGRLDRAAFQAIGERHMLATIITGDVEISDVRPDFTITPGFDFVSVSAEVDVTLDVQMVESSSGASIWSSSASATESVGHVSLFGDNIAFDAEDPDKAYGKLVDALVEKVTRDFRVSWKRK